MNNRTATVETLTAEVRVLMVGSRQVTMSVYDQLDWVPLGDIEPFGRVRPRKPEEGYVYVVGRHMQSENLVRSHVYGDPRDPAAGIERHEADLRDKLTQAKEKADSNSSGPYALSPSYVERASFWRSAEQRLTAELDEWTNGGAVKSAEWCKLPLIVLAGLR